MPVPDLKDYLDKYGAKHTAKARMAISVVFVGAFVSPFTTDDVWVEMERRGVDLGAMLEQAPGGHKNDIGETILRMLKEGSIRKRQDLQPVASTRPARNKNRVYWYEITPRWRQKVEGMFTAIPAPRASVSTPIPLEKPQLPLLEAP